MLRSIYLATEPPCRAQRIRRSVRKAHDPLFAHLSPVIGKQGGMAVTKRRADEPLSASSSVALLGAS